MTWLNVAAEIATKQNATADTVAMAWTVDRACLSPDQIVAYGRQSLEEIAVDRGWCVVADRWCLDGSLLSVTADILRWPDEWPDDGKPLPLKLVQGRS